MKGKHMDERRPGFVNIRSFTYSRTGADPPEDAEYDFASRHRAAPRRAAPDHRIGRSDQQTFNYDTERLIHENEI
ncbi:hypothetical protein [Burkholderia cepacia]|uniref:hypothetical protein n=1 Tax=Burkholderia cepacia TaxID=292 RepID=UPI000F5EFEE9|nr:hypothetical protein [Burkholderia cepacia]